MKLNIASSKNLRSLSFAFCLQLLLAGFFPLYGQVICHTQISLSLGPDCTGEVTPQSFLTNDLLDETLYTVSVNGGTPASSVTITSVGTYQVIITEIATNNFCGPHTLVVNDEIGPEIDCSTLFLDCGSDLPTTEPTASDACCGNQITFNSPFELSGSVPVDDFDGFFATGNWTFNFSAADGEDVFFNASGNQLNLLGNNVGPLSAGDPCNTPDPSNAACYSATACITVPVGGTVSFDWENARAFGSVGHTPDLDPTLYSITPAAGTIAYTVLSSAATDTGTESFALSAGDEFCFIIGSDGGNSISETIIENFSFQAPASDACDQDYVLRRWTATDCNQATSSCVQAIVFNSVAIQAPADTVLFCTSNIPLDAMGNPDPAFTGVPQGCNVSYTYVDINVASQACQGGTNIGCYKVRRQWIMLDECTDIKTIEFQTIQVRDTLGPTIQGVADVTISTTSDACVASYLVPAPMLSDDCSDLNGYTVNASAGTLTYLTATGVYFLSDAPPGTLQLTYRAEDCCGNVTELIIDVTVEDLIPPFANCESFRSTSLTSGGIGSVQAPSFDDGSFDACSPTVWFKAIREDNTNCATLNGDDDPGGANNIWYDDEVFFCCEDVGDTVMVTLRVFDVNPGTGPVNPTRMIGTGDLAGHFNDCSNAVLVRDGLNPFVSCPPNITVSCDFWFDRNNLSSTFGTIVTNIADQNDIIINDPTNPNVPANNNWGQDGIAGNNCGDLTITSDSVSNLTCGAGSIVRVFTTTDQNGLSATCTQTITITNFSPYFISDTGPGNANPSDGVIWPANYENTNVTNCSSDTSSTITGAPIIQNEDACSMVSVTSADEPLLAASPYCRAIRRTWRVTDLCNFPPLNPAVNPGQWSYTQFIYISDGTAPVLSSCDDITLGVFDFDANCETTLNLTNVATDNCQGTADLDYVWSIFLNNTSPSGSVASFSGMGSSISQNVPLGNHSVVWKVRDQCGNPSECVQLVSVVDSLNPVAKAIDGHAINLNDVSESATMLAAKIDGGTFDSCGSIVQRLLVYPSLGSGQISPPIGATDQVTFTCANTSNHPATVQVDFWAQDAAGNWDYVTTNVIVQDNSSTCTTGPSANIAGQVENELGANINNVKVAVGDALFAFTGTSGQYELSDLPTNDDYQVTPILDENYREGVSTLDLVLISRHLIGIKALDSPYKIIAADIDNDKKVSTLDMIELQKLLLYINTSFPNNRSWRFIDAAFDFAEPGDPFASPFPEIYDIPVLENDMLGIDFVGLKVGDVNASANPNLSAPANDREYDGALLLKIEEEDLWVGETYVLEVKAKDFKNIAGYQFAIGFDVEALEFVDAQAGGLLGLESANFGKAFIDEGLILTNWAQANLQNIADDESLFQLTFKVKKETTWSNAIWIAPGLTEPEVYSSNNQGETWGRLLPTFDFGKTTDLNTQAFALYPNKPNPFKEETVLSFYFPEATTAKLTIYDLSGRVLKVMEQTYAMGYHEQVISRTDLAASGILYAKLETNKDFAIQKMILLD